MLHQREGEGTDTRYLYDSTTKLRYQGEIKPRTDQTKSFQPHGEGRFYNDKGNTLYEGIFRDGQISSGRFYTDQGQLIYEGDFKNGDFHGYGKLFNHQGGVVYEGTFKDGIPYGIGRSFDEKGRVEYEGQFVKALRHGFGKLYDEKGKVNSVGLFKDDSFKSVREVHPGYLPPAQLAQLVELENVPVYKFPSLGEPCNKQAASLVYQGQEISRYVIPDEADKALTENLIRLHAQQLITDPDGTYSLTMWVNSPDEKTLVISDLTKDYYRSKAAEHYTQAPQKAFEVLTYEESYSLVILNEIAEHNISSIELADIKNQVLSLKNDERRLAMVPDVLDRYEEAQLALDYLDKPIKSFLREVNKDAAAAYDNAKELVASIKDELSSFGIRDREDFLEQFSLHLKAKQAIPLHQIGWDKLNAVLDKAIGGLATVNQEVIKTMTTVKTMDISKTITPAR